MVRGRTTSGKRGEGMNWRHISKEIVGFSDRFNRLKSVDGFEPK